MGEFEPKIVRFLCNWSSCKEDGLADASRKDHTPNVRTIRVMCSGRVDPVFVLKALQEGADGVLISGCQPGDCHYMEGNHKTVRRFTLLKKMLKQFGVEEERVHLDWSSTAEGDQQAAVISEMTAKIKELGPFSRQI